jgi:hypothetical protein
VADEATVELGNFIAALRQADLVKLKWGDREMLCGNQGPRKPQILTLLVQRTAESDTFPGASAPLAARPPLTVWRTQPAR